MRVGYAELAGERVVRDHRALAPADKRERPARPPTRPACVVEDENIAAAPRASKTSESWRNFESIKGLSLGNVSACTRLLMLENRL